MTAAFRGTVTAAALVLDPDLVGVDEARRRSLALDRCTLSVLPDGRWLAVLADPVELRGERAPGLALIAVDGGLTMRGLDAEPGTVTWLSGGQQRRVPVAGLPPVPTAGWLDLTALPVHRLTPLDEPAPPADRPTEPPHPDPDLRTAAGLGPARPRTATRLASSRPGVRKQLRIVVAVALAIAVAVGLVLAINVVTSDAPTPEGPLPTLASESAGPVEPGGRADLTPVWWVLAVFVLACFAYGFVREGGRGTHSGARTPRPPGPVRRWVSRVIAGRGSGVLGRRQERYLRRLTAQAQQRQWDDLLGDAIALGGEKPGDAWLTRKLPDRRASLQLRTTDGTGPSAAFAGNANAYLRALYTQAAKELEGAGDIERATFVHAELLRDIPAAVALLEQQGRLRLAAEIAESRGSDPGLAVRLWWRAGERDQAVRVARAHGAFAAGVTRLEQVDPAAALDLRRAWVDSCRSAGDHLGAVRAAWPVPELRRSSRPDIAAGAALGGGVAGHLFAHLVAEFPSPESTARAVALLDSDDRSLRRAREGFLATLAQERGRDGAVDRQVCSAAVRSLLRTEPTAPSRARLRTLGERADPLLRADLPALPRRPVDAPVPDLEAPEEPGQLAVTDAVALPGGVVLAAHGDLGVRLYGRDGRTRARWDVVTHQIVVADNGASALLVRHAGGLHEVHRLDLLTRRVRPWATLRARRFAGSFDGTTLTVVDDDGLAFLDTLDGRPRVLWRELDATNVVLALNRTAARTTAIVHTPGATTNATQLWAWELPSRTLRVRRTLDLRDTLIEALAGDATAVLLDHGTDGDAKVTYVQEHRSAVVVPGPPDATVRTDGTAVLVQRPVGDRLLGTLELEGWTTPAHVTFPLDGGLVRVREHDGVVTLVDATGRIVVADPAGVGAVASFATRV